MNVRNKKIFINFLITVMALFPYTDTYGSMQSSSYIMERDSINFTGTDDSASASYRLSDTGGEIGTGELQDRCSSMSFDGNGDYVDAGTGSSLEVESSTYTISEWIKLNSFPPNNGFRATFAKMTGTGASTRGYALSIHADYSGNQHLDLVKIGVVDQYVGWSPSLGTWYHVVAVQGGSSVSYYVNGNYVGAYNDSQAYRSSTGASAVMGGLINTGPLTIPFDGYLDDVRIYNRALSSTEVSDLYNGKHISNTGLAGYWNFDEGSGSAANDMSGNNNTGTIYNATYSTNTPSQTCNIANAGYRQNDVAPSSTYITISSPADVTMSPDFGGISGGTGNGNATWKVTTNNSAGYQLDIKTSTNPAMQNGIYTFANYAPAGADPDFNWSVASNASEFGYSVEGTHTVGKFLDNGNVCALGGSNASDKCWLGLSTSDASVATSGVANDPGGTDTTIKFRAEAGSQRMQEGGDYTATIVMTAVAL